MSDRLQEIKNRDSKFLEGTALKADFDWLIEQAEQTESFKKLHKSYLDRYVDSVGEINRLKEALAFYANPESWEEYEDRHAGYTTDTKEDNGQTARAALEETK